MVYKWKGEVGYSVKAETVGRIFEGIEKRNGAVTSAAVLQSARHESSPIHNVFEWRDDVAAEKYRLQQATTLICNLMVKVETEEEKPPVTVRAYVNVSERKNGEFVSVVKALQGEDSREKVLGDALRELEAFQRKYSSLNELAAVFAAINNLKAA